MRKLALLVVASAALLAPAQASAGCYGSCVTQQEKQQARQAIIKVFGKYARQALTVAKCESGMSIRAYNGQYLGLFQMGGFARSTFGHASHAWGQAHAAYRYFAASGYDWSPWSCKPW